MSAIRSTPHSRAATLAGACQLLGAGRALGDTLRGRHRARRFATRAELVVHVSEMPFSDRPHAQHQRIRDFLIAAAGGHQAQYFEFPGDKALAAQAGLPAHSRWCRRADARYALQPSRPRAMPAIDGRGSVQVAVSRLAYPQI